ncbi:prepilin-type N-terminal cleavage/methylation domain-containing protein [Sulfurovum sp.]|uniref:prepilin-type N-terminal cleavage/methylation domain-containing protein n=1 Tax=Sulfurovum sp. TaxID=1969726 RepID=UPI0028683964|nr:prepilin-type N-terminal cleavage/methylation domain-containing protein [Sulfurovum sp.]
MNKGFSLIELLVVILLVSIVYFLGFEEFELVKPKPQPLTPMNLKAQIIKSELYEGQATLMCLDKCSTCYTRTDLSSPFQAYSKAIDLQNLKAYTLDESDSLVRIEYGRYDDKKICLIMDFYHNGSSTQIILENKEGTYFLPSFFDTPLRFDSPEEAKEYWVKKSHSLSDTGAYY